jgi:hypothetical protein
MGKPEPGYSIREKTTAHWAWEMVGVAVTFLARGKRLDGRVMCSRVAWTGSCSGGSVEMVNICEG